MPALAWMRMAGKSRFCRNGKRLSRFQIGRFYRRGLEPFANRAQLLRQIFQYGFEVGFLFKGQLLPIEFVKGLEERFCQLADNQYLVFSRKWL